MRGFLVFMFICFILLGVTAYVVFSPVKSVVEIRNYRYPTYEEQIYIDGNSDTIIYHFYNIN
ncbi:MAG: hypothetical protein GXO75_15475 [Calditrichaeota bacterium]|nr:hypothetical protein [Calditrichota bacterium]